MNEQTSVQCVIFDLDGTLTDSAPLITQCVRETIVQLSGIDNPARTYMPFVGPPLREGFRAFGISEADLDVYIENYRERYETLQSQTRIFSGVTPTLAALRQAGLTLAIATSKQRDVAMSVCESCGLTQYFDYIAGAVSPHQPSTKADIVADVLRTLEERGVLEQPEKSELSSSRAGAFVRDDVLMVGDRIYDVEGAGEHGIRTVMVTWGGATPAHEFAQAWRVVDSVEELLRTIICA